MKLLFIIFAHFDLPSGFFQFCQKKFSGQLTTCFYHDNFLSQKFPSVIVQEQQPEPLCLLCWLI
jgi:hypothetical protein